MFLGEMLVRPFYSVQREKAELSLSDVELALPHFPLKLVLHNFLKP